jgi:putative chitinase
MNFDRRLVFDAVRKVLGRSFTPSEVLTIDNAISLAMAGTQPSKLVNPAGFYASVRGALGALSQAQVDGFEALLEAMGEARWPLAWTAYGLATAWWETAKAMQPVAEAYFLGDKKAASFRKTLRYYPWYGRGYPQLTWEKNYKWADEQCCLNGALMTDPDLALRPDIAAKIMVKGMEQGAFSPPNSLGRHLPACGRAGHDAYVAARRIINGTDHSEEIAKIAQAFEAALIAGGWQ